MRLVAMQVEAAGNDGLEMGKQANKEMVKAKDWQCFCTGMYYDYC